MFCGRQTKRYIEYNGDHLMAYIGNAPADRFTSIPTVQQFNGDGSTTAFTLSRPVGTDQDLLVSVDGVIQDTAAYAVSNGTTLTFSAAPSSGTANIFVNYLGVTIGSVVHPASSSISAAGASLDGAVTINESSADVDFRVESNGLTNAFVVDGGNNGVGINATPRSDLHTIWTKMFIGQKGSIISESLSAGGIAGIKLTDNIYMDSDTGSFAMLETNQANFISLEAGALQYRSAVSASAGAAPTMVTHMNIDASGAMTKPLQPAFSVHKNGTDQSNIALNTDVTLTWTHSRFDQNSDFDFVNGRFTAPVTGKYQLNGNILLESLDAAADYYIVYLHTSNAKYRFIFDPDFMSDSPYWSVAISVIADMDANDISSIVVNQGGGTSQTDIDGSAEYTNFSGHLVC